MDQPCLNQPCFARVCSADPFIVCNFAAVCVLVKQFVTTCHAICRIVKSRRPRGRMKKTREISSGTSFNFAEKTIGLNLLFEIDAFT